METTASFTTVDAYIATLTGEKKKKIKQMRKLVRQSAPEATELISYSMPALKLHGMLLYYAAWKEHIGLYGITASLIETFQKELVPFKTSKKGTVQFRVDEPLPEELITRMVKFMVVENKKRFELKLQKKKGEP